MGLPCCHQKLMNLEPRSKWNSERAAGGLGSHTQQQTMTDFLFEHLVLVHGTL